MVLLNNAQTTFDPDTQNQVVVGIAAELSQHDSGLHQHKMGQLLFTHHGCIQLLMNHQLCLLPARHLAWIPPHCPHRAIMHSVVGYRSLYLEVAQINGLPKTMSLFEISPLLNEILEKMTMQPIKTNWQSGPAANLLAVCLDELAQAPQVSMSLPFPQDQRLSHLNYHSLPPSLNLLAQQVGASEKTLTRLFYRETQLSYQQWRQQWRYLKAIELLSQYRYLTPIALELGFHNDSAFIAFFKKMSGLSPRAFMANHNDNIMLSLSGHHWDKKTTKQPWKI